MPRPAASAGGVVGDLGRRPASTDAMARTSSRASASRSSSARRRCRRMPVTTARQPAGCTAGSSRSPRRSLVGGYLAVDASSSTSSAGDQRQPHPAGVLGLGDRHRDAAASAGARRSGRSASSTTRQARCISRCTLASSSSGAPTPPPNRRHHAEPSSSTSSAPSGGQAGERWASTRRPRAGAARSSATGSSRQIDDVLWAASARSATRR